MFNVLPNVSSSLEREPGPKCICGPHILVLLQQVAMPLGSCVDHCPQDNFAAFTATGPIKNKPWYLFTVYIIMNHYG